MKRQGGGAGNHGRLKVVIHRIRGRVRRISRWDIDTAAVGIGPARNRHVVEDGGIDGCDRRYRGSHAAVGAALLYSDDAEGLGSGTPLHLPILEAADRAAVGESGQVGAE